MDFLDQVYFNNTIRSYCIVVGTILVALLLKRYLSRYLASLVFLGVNKIWKTISKKNFVDLVAGPSEMFLVMTISLFAIDKLTFPDKLLFTTYGLTSAEILARLASGVIIVLFFRLVLRLMDFIALLLEEKAKLTPDTKDDQLIVFLKDFLKVIIGIIGCLCIIKVCFDQPLGNLLTSLSIVGAALALSARESLENLIASFIIFLDKPFSTGDTVKVNNITGLVERIGLRSTKILTGDKTLVTIPNKQMVDSIVDNWSMRTLRRAEINLELSVKTPMTKVQGIIEEIKRLLESNTKHLSPYSVFLKELSRTGITVTIEYFTAPIPVREFDEIKENINLEIKKILEKNEVLFAGEANTIVINNGEIKEI
jgi:MscS family membrane protein